MENGEWKIKYKTQKKEEKVCLLFPFLKEIIGK